MFARKVRDVCSNYQLMAPTYHKRPEPSQECRLPGSYNTLHEFYGSGIIALAECGVVAQTLKCELLESLLFRACTRGDDT